MKRHNFLILLFLVLMTGCSKDDFETGIKGTVAYGQGDCMPIIDYGSRSYGKYHGSLYFIVKADLDSLGNGDFQQLKNNSLMTFVGNGILSRALPVGTYVVMPEDVYSYSEENTIVVQEGEVLVRNFKFWKCTSY